MATTRSKGLSAFYVVSGRWFFALTVVSLTSLLARLAGLLEQVTIVRLGGASEDLEALLLDVAERHSVRLHMVQGKVLDRHPIVNHRLNRAEFIISTPSAGPLIHLDSDTLILGDELPNVVTELPASTYAGVVDGSGAWCVRRSSDKPFKFFGGSDGREIQRSHLPEFDGGYQPYFNCGVLVFNGINSTLLASAWKRNLALLSQTVPGWQLAGDGTYLPKPGWNPADDQFPLHIAAQQADFVPVVLPRRLNHFRLEVARSGIFHPCMRETRKQGREVGTLIGDLYPEFRRGPLLRECLDTFTDHASGLCARGPYRPICL